MIRECIRIGSFEVDDPAAVLVEVFMLGYVIKSIVVMRNDMLGIGPRTLRRWCFRVPDFPKYRCLALYLLRDHHVTLPIFIPFNGALGDLNVFTGIDILQLIITRVVSFDQP